MISFLWASTRLLTPNPLVSSSLFPQDDPVKLPGNLLATDPNRVGMMQRDEANPGAVQVGESSHVRSRHGFSVTVLPVDSGLVEPGDGGLVIPGDFDVFDGRGRVGNHDRLSCSERVVILTLCPLVSSDEFGQNPFLHVHNDNSPIIDLHIIPN